MSLFEELSVLLQGLLNTATPWLRHLPGLAYVIGILVAASRLRRHPLVASLAICAFALLTATWLLNIVLYRMVVYANWRQNDSIQLAIGGCTSVAQIFAWVLLLFALFHRAAPVSRGDLRLTYGGFFTRFTAFIIDQCFASFVLLIPTAAMQVLLALALGKDAIPLAIVLSTAIDMFGRWIYFAVMESSAWQATFGKQLLGIRVANLAGGRVSFAQATARHFSKILSGFLLLGYLAQLRTPRRQAWHDSIAKCVVIEGGNRDEKIVDIIRDRKRKIDGPA